MCSFTAKMQKKVVVTQSLVIPSLRPMGCINIQILEKELESFPVVVDQDIEVQYCNLSCPVNHQQLPQKWFSEALMFFQSSLLFYTHLHHILDWWGKKTPSNLSFKSDNCVAMSVFAQSH